MNEELKKKIQKELLDPIKDPRRVMKMEYLFSHKYILIAVIIAVDLFLIMAFSFLFHMVGMIPRILGGREIQLFALRNFLPDFTKMPIQGGLAALLIIFIADAYLIYRIRVSWADKGFNVGQEGTDRFTTAEEIQEQYTEIAPLETPYHGNPGVLVSRIGNQFYIDQMVVNNLILGITRSGKGETMVKTSLEIYSRAENRPSLIINDPKIELYKSFGKLLEEERGYKVYLLNASNPLLSAGFNIVDLAIQYYRKKDYDTAEQVLNALAHSLFQVDDATGDMMFFTSSASDLFCAMALASMQDAFAADEEENRIRYNQWRRLDEEERKKHPFHYRNDNEKTIHVYSMIVNFQQLVLRPINRNGSRTLLDIYFENRPETDRARLKYLNTEVAPGKTKSGIFSEMIRHLSKFTLRNVGKMIAESTIDFREIVFGEKPLAVFIATPSYDSSLHQIPSIFIRQMYYALGKICDDQKGKCARQVKIIFDEAGNMPPVDLMATMTTMGLGQNISFDLYLQNYEQLDDLYGESIAETIKGNCGNHFYLQTASKETASEFSYSLGIKSEIDMQRAGARFSLNKYYTESIKKRELLLPNELMQFEEGETAMFRRSKRRDLAGNSIKPRPIHNSRENGRNLWYFYQYAPKEKFPNPNEVNFLEVCKESRKEINLEDRIWDIRKSFQMMGIQLPVKIQDNLHTQKQTVHKEILKQTGNYLQICQMLKEVFGEHYEDEYGITGETTIAEYVGFIHSQAIGEGKKKILLQLV